MPALETPTVHLRRPHPAGDEAGHPSPSSAPDRQAPARQAEDERLDAALANVPHGLCMFDADKRLRLSNSRYGEMYGLLPELLLPGTPLAKIVAYRDRIGNAPVNFPAYASHDGINFRKEGNSLF